MLPHRPERGMEKERTQEEVKKKIEKKNDRRGRRKLEVEKREEARRGTCGQVTLTIKKDMAASGY